MARTPTLRDVARTAGVSLGACSLALGRRPGVSAPTRARVERAAAALGYRVNPLVAAVMAARRRTLAVPSGAVLAWAGEHDTAQLTAPTGVLARYHRGARDRAAEQGWRLETFRWGPGGLPLARLLQVLRSRGIAGVVVAPLRTWGAPLPAADWTGLAVATVGRSVAAPEFHRAEVDNFALTQRLLAELWRRGYRRPSLVLDPAAHERSSQRTLGAFLAARMSTRADPRRDVLLLPESDVAQLAAWLATRDTDVVVTNYQTIDLSGVLSAAGRRVPEEIGIATVCWDAVGCPVSGFSHEFEHAGAAAVDIVIDGLQRNELGVPARAKAVTLPVAWVDAGTLRPESA